MHSRPEPDASRRLLTLRDFAVRSRQVSRLAVLDAAAVEAIEALHAAGVNVLMLKGAALARTLYRDGEVRGQQDVDLLVAPGDLDAAGAVLSKLGYRSYSEERGIVGWTEHADVWWRTKEGFGNVIVDLHWRMDGCEVAPERAWDVLFARRGRVELGGRAVPTFDRTGLALNLGLHAAEHGAEDLKAMGDLERGLERLPRHTWADAAALAGELRATETFAGGLRMVPAGTALADALGLPMGERVLADIARRHSGVRGSYLVEALRRADAPTERVRVLWRALVPPRAWIAWDKPWATRGRAYLAAAYALHLARAPVWAARVLAHRARGR